MTPNGRTAPTLGAAKELLARLVAFDTTSAKTNIPLIEFVEGYLAEHGVKSQRVPTPDGLKASLFATIGPGEGGGIALSGHTDVVPVASQNWDTDPFQMVERDGKLYGRGTCDMKGYLACCLALVPSLKARAAEGAVPHRLLLRRGGGLHRRAADDRRVRQDAPDRRAWCSWASPAT